MFDNLKKKLGSFRKDAEEAAEENVEEVEAGEDDGRVDAESADAGGAVADESTPGESPSDASEPTDAASEPRIEDEPTDTGARPDDATATDVESVETGVPAEIEDADTVAEDADATAEIEDTDSAAGTLDGTATAAPDEDADADSGGLSFGDKARSLVKGEFMIAEEVLEESLEELEMALLTSDVEMEVAREIIDNIRDELVNETRSFTSSTEEVVEQALQDAIRDVISVGQFDFDERIAVEDKPAVLLFTGVNGVGKTTTIAKMSRYLEERGYSTVLANGDTYRAGANQQIQEHADALGRKCISHEQGGDPAAVLYDAVEYAEANDVDVVLADTAGRLHTNEGLMDQLEKIDRVVDPDLTLFVDEAVAGQDAVNRAREFDEAAEIDGAILTKADADSNGGAAISIAHVTGKPILFLGVGQGYDDLERFDPDEVVARLLEEE
ncbi:signal recognition particle-docking protein FtsY [Natronococcus sp. JC468]|uniref:signal recognition particle-docking protein FtsY n=1 Tax=Natronococcus sp. JC468 TaxID=1961921 RepID=UPI0014394562|nr:signal recognition particle-docking protein FtsY [Natronococcus sp. JC468]NKE35082.1 signal recognition particle-docking protein FtsY [Natronococcus sp. JC468]